MSTCVYEQDIYSDDFSVASLIYSLKSQAEYIEKIMNPKQVSVLIAGLEVVVDLEDRTVFVVG